MIYMLVVRVGRRIHFMHTYYILHGKTLTGRSQFLMPAHAANFKVKSIQVNVCKNMAYSAFKMDCIAFNMARM